MGCLSKRIKTSLMHAFYVGGITFFSVLSIEFVDRSLSLEKIFYCLITSFISFGLSFFASIGIQSKNENYTPPSEKCVSKSSIKKNKRGNIINWNVLFEVVHKPFIRGDC